MADIEWIEPPAPDPDMVTAARRHLTSEYASGVERLFWELEKRPMPDTGAVSALVSAHEAKQEVDALSIGAALVLLQSLRLEIDVLEAGVFDAASEGGLSPESLAAVLDLPGAEDARLRGDYLRTRRELAQVPGQSPPGSSRAKRSAEAAEEAASAAMRAHRAGSRATAAAQRRQELRTRRLRAGQAELDKAAARASESKVQAGEAAERVAIGLLRAASALDQCAARYEEWRGATNDPKLRELAEEYANAARRYRQIAARYRDIGGCSHHEP